jgi:hypothetical protein
MGIKDWWKLGYQDLLLIKLNRWGCSGVSGVLNKLGKMIWTSGANHCNPWTDGEWWRDTKRLLLNLFLRSLTNEKSWDCKEIPWLRQWILTQKKFLYRLVKIFTTKEGVSLVELNQLQGYRKGVRLLKWHSNM